MLNVGRHTTLLGVTIFLVFLSYQNKIVTVHISCEHMGPGADKAAHCAYMTWCVWRVDVEFRSSFLGFFPLLCRVLKMFSRQGFF